MATDVNIGTLEDEKIFNLLLKFVENEQKKKGTLRDDDSLESQQHQTIRERIHRVLDNLVRKMELVISISKAMEDVDVLESLMPDSQIEFLQILSEEAQEGDSLEAYERDILDFLDDIFGSKDLRIKLDCLKVFRTEEEDRLIQTIKSMKKVSDWRMQMTADKDLEKEKILHKMFKANLKMEEKINDVRIKSNQQKCDHQIDEKMKVIESHRSQIDEMKRVNREIITKEIFQSEQSMLSIFESNAAEQEQLKKDVEVAELNCKQLLQDNLVKEKVLREQKVAAQLALKSWLNQYDNDIGDRTKRLNELNAIYDKEQSCLDDLRSRFEIQEKEYFRLMAQKEAEEKQIQEEKLLLFLMNRAAICIQRAWRKVLAKKKLKKGKKGKGKGKKKK